MDGFKSIAKMTMLYTYTEEVNPNLICCICRFPFEEPVTTSTCSHTFCRGCITESLAQTPQCPIDRSGLDISDLSSSPAIVRNLVDELLVHCRHPHCGAVVQRATVQQHEATQCAYTLVQCSAESCGEEVLRRDLDGHASRCGARIEACQGCHAHVLVKDSLNHMLSCEAMSEQCTVCHIQLKPTERAEHIAQCSEIILSCPSASHGCPATPKRSELPEHIKICAFQAMSTFFAVNDARFAKMTREHETLVAKTERLEEDVRAARREAEDAKRALGHFHGRRGATREEQRERGVDLQPTETIAPDSIPWPSESSNHLPDSTSDPLFSSSVNHSVYNGFAPLGTFAMAPARLRPLSSWSTMSISEAVTALRNVVQGLAHSMDGIERRFELRTTTESLRVLEEVGSLRAILHGLRMQVMKDRTQVLQGTPWYSAPLRSEPEAQHVAEPRTSTPFTEVQARLSSGAASDDTHIPFEFARPRQTELVDGYGDARREDGYAAQRYNTPQGSSGINVSRHTSRRESILAPKL